MIQGTTPTFLLSISGVDLSGQKVYVTISNSRKRITLKNDRLTVSSDETGATIAFQLTQQETLLFPAGTVEVQVRFIDAQGTAQATDGETYSTEVWLGKADSPENWKEVPGTEVEG